MKDNEVVEGASPLAALTKSPCDGYERTSWLYVTNDTRVEIVLCLFQVKCSFADDIPPPYIADTGVYVGGTNLGAGGDCHSDPCAASGNAPIAGNFGACSLRVKHPNGQEQTINMGDQPWLPDGRYYPSMGWRLSYQEGLDSNGDSIETVVAEPITQIKVLSK